MDAPFDQRIARVLVRPLAKTPVSPNHLTTLTLLLALSGAALFATGEPGRVSLGAGLFVLARFLDHFDGELARLQGTSSRFGYYYDYVAGALSYGALFLGMGLGLRETALGGFAVALGLAGTTCALLAMFLNLDIDRQRDAAAGSGASGEESGEASGDAVGYPGFAGFELEDGIYLLAPITWLGWVTPFFVAAGIGATVYTLWTLSTLVRMRRGAR